MLHEAVRACELALRDVAPAKHSAMTMENDGHGSTRMELCERALGLSLRREILAPLGNRQVADNIKGQIFNATHDAQGSSQE